MICVRCKTHLRIMWPGISVFMFSRFLLDWHTTFGKGWFTWKDVSKVPFSKESIFELVVWPATRKIWVKIWNVIFPNPWIFPFGPSFVCVFCYTQVEGDGVNHQPVNHHLTMDSRLLQHKQANLAASCRNPAKPPSSSSSWLAKSSPSISFSFLVFLLLLKAMSQI